MSSCKSVLRLGASIGLDNDYIITVLKDALLLHLNGNKDGSINFNNKYFNAQVLVKKIKYDEDIEKDNQMIEDGVLLLFDVSSPSSFDSMANAHVLAESNSQCGKLIRLCIGVKTGTIVNDNEEYSRRVLWCIDRGYEYVEADLSKEGILRGHESREKDGFARICEAISSTMWSNALIYSKINTLEVSDETPNDFQPEFHYVEESNPDLNGSVKLSSNCGTMSTDKVNIDYDGKFSFGDMGVNDLDQVIVEAKRIREESKNKKLSDNERKKRASDAAIMLMSVLDNMGFENNKIEESSGNDEEKNNL